MTDSTDSPEPTATTAPATTAPAAAARSGLRWVTAVVGVLALAGVVLGGLALSRSAARPAAEGPAAPTYTDQQRADAKARACKAFDVVRKGVSRNTHLQVPGGAKDAAGTLAVAANARISLFDGGQYLLARIDPATPPELADAVRAFADTLMDIGAAATAGALDTDPDQVARLHSADEANAAIGKMCE